MGRELWISYVLAVMAPLPANYQYKAQGAEAKSKATAKKKAAKKDAPTKAERTVKL